MNKNNNDIEVVTFFTTLCRLAVEEAEARKNGTIEQIIAAVSAHEAYKELCLREDVEMAIPEFKDDGRE